MTKYYATFVKHDGSTSTHWQLEDDEYKALMGRFDYAAIIIGNLKSGVQGIITNVGIERDDLVTTARNAYDDFSLD